MSVKAGMARAMSWLLIGGAGYIGAHVLHRLVDDGQQAVVLDDLSTGRRDRLPAGVPFIEASCLDQAATLDVIRGHGVTGVIFLAGRKSAADSVSHPLGYYRANVEALRAVLETMDVAGVRHIVLSSSAAVYGVPAQPAVGETSSTVPINPYGETKLVSEWLLRSAGVACGLSWVSLRYFNVVGAARPHLADRDGMNLLSIVLRCARSGEPVRITGTDYPTADGTGVRDYVHASDVADAHLAAVRKIELAPSADVYNVGTGLGYSVLDIVRQARAVTGLPIRTVRAERRPGDPAEVVARVDKIADEIGWRARFTLHDMVCSAWEGARLRGVHGSAQ
jgi:UDP-glucose 4-epimerase